MKDIKHRFIPRVSTQEEDTEEKGDLFQSRIEKIEKQFESKKFESSKVQIHHNIMVSTQVQGTTLLPKLA